MKIYYKKPFNWVSLLAFFEKRAIKGVEKVEGNKYYRTVSINNKNGYIVVGNNDGFIDLYISNDLNCYSKLIVDKVKYMFDLDCNPDKVYDTLKNINDIIPGGVIKGTRVPGCFDAFETSVRAVVGQLISVEKSILILEKLTKKYGTKIKTDVGLDYVFPTSDVFCNITNIYDELCPFKLTRTKVDAIIGLSNLFNKPFNKEDMLKIKGVGSWTVNYISMRAFKDYDVFLDTDYVVKKVLKGYNIDNSLYSPYRSYLTIGLWHVK